MIPTNYLGSSFLNPAINQNQPVLTSALPEPRQIIYEDTVAHGGPKKSRLVVFGSATVRLHNKTAIPRKFSVELTFNGVHDVAMVDRIE